MGRVFTSFSTLGTSLRHRDELTIDVWLTRGNRDVQLLLYTPEEFSALLQAFCGSKLLVNIGGAEDLRHRLLRSVLAVPDPSLPLHRKTQEVWVIDRV